MSTTDNQETIPTEAEQVADEPMPTKEETTSHKRRGGGGAMLLALLAIAGTAAGLWYGYQYSQKLIAAQSDLSSRLQGVESGLGGEGDRLAALEQGLAAVPAPPPPVDLAPLQQQITELRAEVQRLRVEKPEPVKVELDQTRLIGAEVEYLLRMANRRLRLEGDVAAALSALESADVRLRDTGDPVWDGVRGELATELIALRGVKAVDLAGLSHRLTGLSHQVESLQPIASGAPTEAVSEEAAPAAASAEQERDLSTLADDLWKEARSLLVIRRHEQSSPMLLPPEQLYFLKQNLRLQLEAVRLALIRRDSQAYQAGLKNTEQWVREFFSPSQNAVETVLTEIAALKQVEIQPQLPDISGSLRTLHAQLQGAEEKAE
jgi:uroporphyrin-3 C-methyltransferase